MSTVIQLPQVSLAPKPLPAVLTIAGSDSSGGAGIEADLKTFTLHGVYGLTCITALTAQNTQGVEAIANTSEKMLQQILKRNLDDFFLGYPPGEQPLKVIKTGMLTLDAIKVLGQHTQVLESHGVKLVMDPVMVSTSGDTLFDDFGVQLSIDELIEHAFLLTPNFQEAQVLYRTIHKHEPPAVTSRSDFISFVKDLKLTLKCSNLLVKGGHIPWDKTFNKPFEGEPHVGTNVKILDILCESSGAVTTFESDYIDNSNSHGTGCTLASAIAANLAKSTQLSEAIAQGIDYVHRGMLGSAKLGHGKHGPLNHMVPLGSTTIETEDLLPATDEPFLAVKGDYLDYFVKHESIRPHWSKYVNHKFVSALASDDLPFERFLYFLKQDYYYLVNYAHVHGLAAAVAPHYSQTLADSLIIGSIVTEIEKHKKKLSQDYGVDFDGDVSLDSELKPGPACTAYCNYLLEIARSEDYLGIKVALAPCLFGYNQAGIWGQKLRLSNKTSIIPETLSAVYSTWLDEYTGEWYSTACATGEGALQKLFEQHPVTSSRMEELVAIFQKVTELEVSFWDEVLQPLD